MEMTPLRGDRGDLSRNVTDRITDFETGDKLDFSSMFSSERQAQNAIEVEDTADGTLISARFGSRNYDVVLLENVHGVTEDDMFANDWIIV